MVAAEREDVSSRIFSEIQQIVPPIICATHTLKATQRDKLSPHKNLTPDEAKRKFRVIALEETRQIEAFVKANLSHTQLSVSYAVGVVLHIDHHVHKSLCTAQFFRLECF